MLHLPEGYSQTGKGMVRMYGRLMLYGGAAWPKPKLR